MRAPTVSDVLDDLVAEQEALDVVVADLTVEQWMFATPSPGWTVADQIGHLTYFDRTAALAIVDPEAFQDAMNTLLAAGGPTSDTADDITLGRARTLPSDELIAEWRMGRAELAGAGATLHDDDRVEWYGPSMGARSFLTARLMEAWAHGQDVVDALAAHGAGVERRTTDRLRHIAQLGYITRGWTYANRGLETPSAAVRVELTLPSGEALRFGPDDGSDGSLAIETIVGPAVDFCLVTTQRRHVDDTELAVTGASARDWMEKAQLFAGPPTDGPTPHRNFGRG